MIKKLKNKKFVVIWGVLLCCLLLAALFPGVFASHNPEKADLASKFLPAGGEYPLGTDHMGRCILCRLIYGARTSLFVAGAVVVLTALAGTTVGMFSGYYGGKVDTVLMRIVDVFLGFPSFLFTLAFVGMFGGGTRNLILVLSAFGWMHYARVVRSEILVLREKEFIQAEKGMGAGNLYIMMRHILPNIIASVLVIMTMEAGSIILSVSGLSFLGIGVQPPTPEWGYMLNDAKTYLSAQPELMFYPGLAIMITIIIFNFFGDSLRDAMDVKSSRLVKES